jgi:hypothetical protein
MRTRHAGPVVIAAFFLGPSTSAHPGLRTVRGLELSPVHAAAVERAVEGAVRRLAAPGCRRIFSEFRDEAGAPLQAHLDALRVDAAEYLSLVHFADGSARRTCQRGDVVALTAPGSRVVYVCGRWFGALERSGAARAEIVVLHEALHTLGLGENPPTSTEITRRIGALCGG